MHSIDFVQKWVSLNYMYVIPRLDACKHILLIISLKTIVI